MNKRIVIGCLVLLAFLALAALVFLVLPSNRPYEFEQSVDQIKSIEIAIKEYDYDRCDAPMEVVMTVDPTDHANLIEEILKIPGGRIVPPGTGFGSHIIVITYKDGMKEFLGNYNNGYMTADGKVYSDAYAFNTEGFFGLLSLYLGEEVTEPVGFDPTASKGR